MDRIHSSEDEDDTCNAAKVHKLLHCAIKDEDKEIGDGLGNNCASPKGKHCLYLQIVSMINVCHVLL